MLIIFNRAPDKGGQRHAMIVFEVPRTYCVSSHFIYNENMCNDDCLFLRISWSLKTTVQQSGRHFWTRLCWTNMMLCWTVVLY